MVIALMIRLPDGLTVIGQEGRLVLRTDQEVRDAIHELDCWSLWLFDNEKPWRAAAATAYDQLMAASAAVGCVYPR